MAKNKAKPAKSKRQIAAPIAARGLDLENALKDKMARAAAVASVFQAGLLEHAKADHWMPALSMLADLTEDAYQAAHAYIEHHRRFEQATAGLMVQK